jgi:hypothetical protein
MIIAAFGDLSNLQARVVNKSGTIIWCRTRQAYFVYKLRQAIVEFRIK